MCRLFYIASDIELPERGWREDRPSFYAESVSAEDRDVRGHFTHNNVAYVGSHTKCGCGFIEAPENDPEEIELRKRTVSELAEYLTQIIAKGGSLQAAVLWAGNESDPSITTDPLKVADFLLDEFPLEVNEFAKITPNQAHGRRPP
jgi:hypothetical protein